MDAPTNESIEQQLAEMRAHILALENELDRVRTGQSRHAASTEHPEVPPATDDSSSRRQLLRRGAVALGAGATAVALGTQPAAAANGDTITVGGAFNGTFPTAITSSGAPALSATTTNTNSSASGLWGYNLATTNAGSGVSGYSASSQGIGVLGTTAGSAGVLGQNTLSAGSAGSSYDGVRGEANASNAYGIGVRGTGRIGVSGEGPIGVSGTSGQGGTAVSGVSSAFSGVAYAVRGVCNSIGGYGVAGTGGTGIGGRFEGAKAAVAAIGKVGVGTESPGAPVHVKTSGSPDATELLLLLDSTKPPQQLFQNSTTGAKWFFAMTSDDQFKISRDGTGKVEAKFFANGNLQIAGTLIQTSDVNVKTDIAPADTAAVLDAIAALDISTWAYKSDPSVTHLGPTAQGFAAAFGLGDTDTGIAAVDADGVALAAIQALNTKLETDNANHAADNARLGREIAELRALIER